MALTFGIHIGHLGGPLDEMRRLWAFADAHGFDWFSVSDHFQESPPQGGDGDCFESVTALTAAALETRHVRLGCLVWCINYRNPGLLAKSLTTIDHLSGGRVECGLGAGWHALEYQAFGIPFERIGVREDQLEEYAQVMRRLFDPAKVAAFDGKHFRLQEARNNPKPLQPHLRIWIGGRGEKRTLRAAARHADGWNAPYIGPAEWARKSAVLDDWCATEGRDPRAVLRTVNVGFYLGADARGAARAEALYQSHFGTDPRDGFLRGTPDQAVEKVAAYREAGVQRINIALRQGPYDWDALAAYAEQVLPAFGATRPA
jgi:alkanesulfonate monooxygenase SsuD/methylene tetrahydromethanopterin reductase-like flavin-dependent oxidoreductase (luciferase family)